MEAIPGLAGECGGVLARNAAADHERRERPLVPQWRMSTDRPSLEPSPEEVAVRSDERRRLRLLVADLPELQTRDEAAALVEAVLVQAGMEGWEIQTGSLSVPFDRMEEIERHVENSCWVYSTTGWTADGTRVFWIAGK